MFLPSLRLEPSSKACFQLQQADARLAHATATSQVQMQHRAPHAPPSHTQTICAHVPPSPRFAQGTIARLAPARWASNTFSLIPPTGDTKFVQCDLQKEYAVSIKAPLRHRVTATGSIEYRHAFSRICTRRGEFYRLSASSH